MLKSKQTNKQPNLKTFYDVEKQTSKFKHSTMLKNKQVI